ncbi:hypothetical protein D1007_22106 [Hordeum vulgare]|nr:hypothetical protein D1007_22106 [Hordeum vulgare]
MEFQFLSEQLGIAIADNEESPQLDRLRSEAYESGRPDHLSCKESFAEALRMQLEVQKQLHEQLEVRARNSEMQFTAVMRVRIQIYSMSEVIVL